MKATLVQSIIDPRRISEAVQAVESELVPGFLGHAGSRHGYWMAHRPSGRLLILTLWDGVAELEAAATAEAERRSAVGDRLGVRTVATRTMDVVGAHEERSDDAPRVRWVRTTRVHGLPPALREELPALYREAVPDQSRSRGFCASYWLVHPTNGSGLGLSFWEGPTEFRESEASGRRRREHFEAVLGCTVAGVEEFEALRVASVVTDPPSNATIGPRCLSAGGLLADLGTPLKRPPGALLAVSGTQTDQVVVVLDGSAAVVRRDDLRRLDPGHHFGGRHILDRSAHAHTVMATSPVQLGIISRTEFADLTYSAPETVRELVDHDADP